MYATGSFGAQAMVLAAGRGERMRPLTDATPKPLLLVQGVPLIEWHLRALQASGVRRVLVNTGWLGEQIPDALTPCWPEAHSMPETSDTEQRLCLAFSREDLDFGGALETAGGIARALPALSNVFWLVAADVFVPGFAFEGQVAERFAQGAAAAHLWLVPNPVHHPKGDFGISAEGLAVQNPPEGCPRWTYSTIALFKKAFFTGPWSEIEPGNPNGVKAPLAPMLRRAMDAGQVSAEVYHGPWVDVGTPERLAQLNGLVPA